MKIVHICIAGTITEGLTYQDNLLSKYHARLGHEVSIITHCYTRNLEPDATNVYKKLQPGCSINTDNVKVIRLELSLGKNNSSKFKRVKNLYKVIEEEKPDILFVHGCQFLDVDVIAKYVKNNENVKLFVDNHADFSNSATTFVSKYILHRILWKHCAHLLLPYCQRFYGVLPARVDFLINEYKLPREKVELLVMGADDDFVEKAKKENKRNLIRKNCGIRDKDFLIVTGGVIDPHKYQTINLMEATHRLADKNTSLIAFGKVTDDLKQRVDELNYKNVHYIGWINSEESYDYFEAADVVVFPGRHSVFWEQVVGQGKPMVVKDWPGTRHVDLNGNVIFLKTDSTDELLDIIKELIDDPEKLNSMRSVAETKGMKTFSYLKIAERSIMS